MCRLEVIRVIAQTSFNWNMRIILENDITRQFLTYEAAYLLRLPQTTELLSG